MKKILKYVLFLIVGVIVLVLVAALFIPKKYHVERSVAIMAPQSMILDQVKDLKKANEWSPFMEQDPNIKVTYAGPAGQVGSSSHWESEKSGAGTQTITGITNDRVDVRINFLKPFEGVAMGYFQTKNEGSAVNVTWGMDGEDHYPMNIMVLCMDNMLGKVFAKGLNNLKTRCEAMPKAEVK